MAAHTQRRLSDQAFLRTAVLAGTDSSAADGPADGPADETTAALAALAAAVDLSSVFTREERRAYRDRSGSGSVAGS